jgi:small subunit ribosomal protein S25e
MGANKKKSDASSEKTLSSAAGEKKKEGRDNVSKIEEKGRQKQRLAVLVEEAQGKKTLQGMRAITAQGFARISGIKISVANNFIRTLELKGVLSCIGGYSGHRVYKMNNQG